MKLNDDQLAALYELVCRCDDIVEIDLAPSGDNLAVYGGGHAFLLNSIGELRAYEAVA